MMKLSTHQKAVWIAEKLNSILKRGDPERLGRVLSSGDIKSRATPEEIDYWFITLGGGEDNV